MRYLLISISVAAAYCYYNWQFFQYEREMLNIRKTKGIYIQIAFLINYICFITMTFLKLHLCINWTVFLIFLTAENLVIFKCLAGRAYILALTGTAVGLASNVFFRCAFAIALNKPLAVFDNNALMNNNLKHYSVFLGFLATGILFHVIRAKGVPAKIRTIIEENTNLRFLSILQSILYLYLVLNLLGYYTKGNSIPMKMWGIKSALFSTFGLILLVIYVVYMNEMNMYQKKIKMKREELLATKKDEERIWVVAFTDTLTGCYNRQYAYEMFAGLEETAEEVVLCFVDLDGLKTVNDNYGHPEGDQYLLTAVKCLWKEIREGQDYIFRYGGDEFLLLYRNTSPETVDFRMRKVQQQLQELSNTPEYPFVLSVSYGIASRSEAKNLKETVMLADERMYERKQKKKTARGRWII